MSESTEQLVARAKQGDKSAIDGLYLEYKDRLTKFVIKQGLTQQDAEDVVSESFVDVVRGIDKLENDEYFGTWLHKIALRKANDTKRKAAAHRRVIFEENEETGLGGDMAAVEQAFEAEYGDTVMLPSDYAENEDTKRIIAEQINSLSGEHKEALVLFYYENRSINEIAEMTGTNVNNAKARLFRARQGLKKKLEVLQKKGITLCAVPISGLLAELDEGGKGAAAAAASGESAAAASTEAAAVTTSSTAKLAALAAVAVIVVGVGFAVTKLSHLSGDYRPENSSEAVTTTATTTTTTTPSLVTTAVPEIADESADESLTVTTTTTTATNTTEAVTEAPAGGTTEAVIAPPAAEPEKEPTEHDRWVESIDGSYTYYDLNDLEKTNLNTADFKELYKQGLANAYADGCGYMLVPIGGGGCDWWFYDLVDTKDGGKSWVVREDDIPLHYPTNGFSLDNGSWLLVWWDHKGSMSIVRDAISVNGGVVSFAGVNSWLKGLPLSDGTVPRTNGDKHNNERIVMLRDLEYLGGLDFKLTIIDSCNNYFNPNYDPENSPIEDMYIDGINPNTFEGEVLFDGTVTLDPATLNIKYYTIS